MNRPRRPLDEPPPGPMPTRERLLASAALDAILSTLGCFCPFKFVPYLALPAALLISSFFSPETVLAHHTEIGAAAFMLTGALVGLLLGAVAPAIRGGRRPPPEP